MNLSNVQLADIVLWADHASVHISRCSPVNYYVSKYAIPFIVFLQHLVQNLYPSEFLKSWRVPIIAFCALPCIGMSYQFGCSTLVTPVLTNDVDSFRITNTISISMPISMSHGCQTTLCWGGLTAETWQILVHSGIVAMFFLLLMPFRVAFAHVGLFGCVISYLYMTEGTLALGSKWCTYCMVYGLFYVFEPLWMPEPKAHQA